MSETKTDNFAKSLLDWFDQHGRKDLPWQENKTAYRVWISEIMLQQTQVATVIEYYLRFMNSFPDVNTLADAEEDRVLEHWAGLGYYARARNLHKAAKRVAYELGGKFPEDLEGLISLPGIGRSTAGAIRSIAHKQYAPILDGNVKRVLCRYHAIQTWSGERKTEQYLWELADEHTPATRFDDYTQAIMDLGATLCKRSKPECHRCPMQDSCQAYQTDQQHSLPKSKPKKIIPQKQIWALVIESDHGLLLEKRPPSGIWGSLYSLPEASPDIAFTELEQHCTDALGLETELVELHESVHHTFSHYKLEIKPVRLRVLKNKHEIRINASYNWHKTQELDSVALPAPISAYLKNAFEDSLFS